MFLVTILSRFDDETRQTMGVVVTCAKSVKSRLNFIRKKLIIENRKKKLTRCDIGFALTSKFCKPINLELVAGSKHSSHWQLSLSHTEGNFNMRPVDTCFNDTTSRLSLICTVQHLRIVFRTMFREYLL